MDDIDPRIETGAVFRSAELKAEGLVGIVRMVVALSLGTLLFFVVASSDPPYREMLQRQWFYASLTTCGYFAIGLLAWIAVRRGVFRGWMVWALATVDCVFILTGVWQGVANTGLPGSFGFAFPSIWLVPLVMAFGALRFDPLVPIFVAVVLISGIVAIEFLIPEDADGPANFAIVDIFLGGPPTFVRLAMLALACLILALAAFRARRLLLRALTQQHRTSNLVRYLPRQLASRLADGGLDELRKGERQEMAILFIDMRGFTTLSEDLAPQEVTQLVTEYRARITRATHAAGGMIDKFMGDAALVVFPGKGDSTAGRACLTCAQRLAWDIADWSAQRQQTGAAPVRVGIGLHWGSVFCGVVGDDERLEYSVFGDAVNTAARLEELTKAEQVQIVASRALLDNAGLPAAPNGWHVLSQRAVRGRSGEIEILGWSMTSEIDG